MYIRLTQHGAVSEKVSEQKTEHSVDLMDEYLLDRKDSLFYFLSWRNILWQGSENHKCISWKELRITSGISVCLDVKIRLRVVRDASRNINGGQLMEDFYPLLRVYSSIAELESKAHTEKGRTLIYMQQLIFSSHYFYYSIQGYLWPERPFRRLCNI